MWRRYTWLLTFLACHGKSDKLPFLNGWWRVHIYGNLTRKMIMSGILRYPVDRPTWILSLVVAGWHNVFTRLGATKNNAWKRGTIGFTTSCKLGMRTTQTWKIAQPEFPSANIEIWSRLYACSNEVNMYCARDRGTPNGTYVDWPNDRDRKAAAALKKRGIPSGNST